MRPTGQPPKSSARRGWRGAQAATREPAKYNWQRDASDAAAAASSKPDRRLRWRLAAYSVIGVLLLAAFVKTLLFAPPKTPFVLIAPSLLTPYDAPLPPDAWVAEDADRFRKLDDAGAHSAGILLVHDGSRDWHAATQGLEGFRRQLRELAASSDRSDAIVIYVSMHGAVDDDGKPCLILPSSSGLSALETSSWIPVENLLRIISDAGFRDDALKLLVLDSSRFRVNWSLGTIFNEFSAQLQNVVDEEFSDVPNLAVFNSVSPGEISWTSQELQGSIFAHFLQRGLSGEADDRAGGGNQDRRVSLQELEQYVSRQVRQWVWHNRGEHQNPAMFKSRAVSGDATISWALRQGERTLIRQHPSESPSDAEQTLRRDVETDRVGFWQRYAILDETGAATTDPLSWARLQQSLVRLEQCLAAGRAYRSAALDQRGAVTGLLRKFDELKARTANTESGCFVGASRHEFDELRLLPATSLALASAFHSAPSGELQSLNSALDSLTAAPNQTTLTGTLSLLESIPSASRLVEVHFVRLLNENRILDRYPDPSVLSTALEVRRLAESAAGPCDERLHARLRNEIDAIDAARRHAEDQLFAGLELPSNQWDSIRQQYSGRAEFAEQATLHLRWRDRVLSELPWLAQWLTRLSLQSGRTDQEQLDGEIADNLRSVVRAVCRTTESEFLAQPASDDLENDYRILRSRIDEHYNRLLSTTKANGPHVRDALALLEMPLLPTHVATGNAITPVDAREALRALVSQWTSQLAAGQSDSNNNTPSDTDAERGSRFLTTIESNWRYHPAIEMFADAEQAKNAAGEIDPAKRLFLREALLRRTLVVLPDDLKALRTAAAAAASADEARANWDGGERLTRVLAGLMVASLDVDAVLELRRVDLQQLLTWQGQRALDDFYGSAENQQAPYFAVAAGACLTAARQLAGNNSATRGAISATENALDQLRMLATGSPHHKLLISRASDVVIIDEQIPASTTVVLGPHSAQNGSTLPPGLASLYVDQVPDRPQALPTVDVPLNGSTQRTVPILEEFVCAMPAGAGGPHVAVLAFRGHRFVSPFEIAHLVGPESRYVPSQSDAAEIVVIGPQQRAPDVMIILDCSASMQRPLTLEGGKLRRFDAALLALRSMLEGLAQQGNLHIGMTLFGHRARWDHEHLGEVLQQPDYGRPISPNQMPYDDVETVLPVGRFDPTIGGQLFETLQTATPWGESPLFLALIEAVRQFPAGARTPSQSIVLITDGLNSQFNAPRDKRKYLPDVIQALSVRQIPIHVVGFGIDQAEAAEAQQAYQQLADVSRGSYAPVEEATELVDYLRGLITRETFTVQDGGHFLETATVGSRQRVDQLSSRVQPLTVSTTTAALNVSAEGGESLRLQLSPDGSQLTVEPYLAGNPRFFPLTGAAGAQWLDLNLVVHQPLRKQETVDFELSLQDRLGQFVPRPRSVWAEITPVMPDGTQDATYTYYDRQFQDDVGVPILRWSAANWPAQAAQAEIQFFCRFDSLDADQTVPAESDPPSGDSRFVSLPGPSGGTLTIESPSGQSGELRIVEQYDSSVPDFPAFRIEIDAPVREIIRQFDERHRVCLHRFRATGGDAANLTAASIRITRRDRERIGAWQLSTPIRVDIAAADGLIVVPPQQATAVGPALRPAD